MDSKVMRRAKRSARAVIHGSEILEFMNRTSTLALLMAAVNAGEPPVMAVSAGLIKICGEAKAKLPPVKQFAGLCIRAVLERKGYSVAETGVRVSNDPLFRTGATYKPSDDVTGSDGLLSRFLHLLTDEEVQEALSILKARAGRSR